MSITLKTSDELLPVVQPILEHLFGRIRVLLPDAELHHIGATAVPGALTKGDIDILLRMSPSEFTVAVAALKQHFRTKQPANWSPEFASFGDDTAYALPVGVQVVVKGSSVDFLLFFREYFIKNSEALDEYNRLKATHFKDGQEGYWKAKDEFLSKILAARKT
jgi:GrpB-like predicted nucleotidyltransferase (UPF0157 family)